MPGLGVDEGPDRLGGPLDPLGRVAEDVNGARAQVRRADALGLRQDNVDAYIEAFRKLEEGK